MAVAQDRLHPEARALIDTIGNVPPYSTMMPAQVRALPTLLSAAPEPVETVVERGIPGPGGILGLRIYYPAGVKASALVWFHGGGWGIGSVGGSDGACRAPANRARCAVISVDYPPPPG